MCIRDRPVKAISSEFDDIYKIGYNDYFEEIFPLEQIKDLINHSGSHLDINLDSNIDIYYKVVSISKFNKNKGFFVLGPISNKPVGNTSHNIPYRSLECSNYMSKLILNIACLLYTSIYIIYIYKLSKKISYHNFLVRKKETIPYYEIVSFMYIKT